MAKKLKDEDLKLNIIVNGDKAKKELGDLEKSTRNLTSRNKELRAEKQKLERAGKKETEQYKAVTKELRQNNSAIKTNETRMAELRKEIGVTGLTMKQLRSEQTRLRRLMDNATYGTPQWKKLNAELTKVETQMAVVRAGSKKTQFSLSGLANGFNKYFNIIAAGAATLTGIVFSVKEWTKGLVGLDDQLADVMKTTGLTRKEVRGLYTDFKYLNTRTPRKELLLLAEEAGRLGIKGTKNIASFVEVANKIKVALGDDLGGESEKAIREVGKLVEVYKVGNQYGTSFEESLEKVGSAINEVSANSNSQAEYQIGFMKRLGGTATQAGLSAAQILGYASTLDQLGQSQEMAATAMGKTIISMFKDSAEYAAMAKMEHGEFYTLLKTDANAAFMAVLEGLNGNNEGLTVMARKLDDLGIDGARAVQVLSALSSNTKMVRDQQDLANTAMKEGTSLANEYNVKNNNLAGSMDKIGRAIRSKFINSGFLGWMEKAVAKAAEWVKIPVAQALIKEQTQVNALTAALYEQNIEAAEVKRIKDELVKIAPDIVKTLDDEGRATDTTRVALEKYNDAMITRIALASKEEEIRKLNDKAGEQRLKRGDLELKGRQLITDYIQKDVGGLGAVAQELQESGKSIFDQLRELQLETANATKEIPDSYDVFGPYTQLGMAIRREKELQEELKDLYEYRDQLNIQFNNNNSQRSGTSAGGNAGGGSGAGGTGSPDGGSGESNNEKAANALELAYKQREVVIKQQYLNEETLQKEFQARMLANEIAYLQAKAGLETDETKRIELQSQIIDKQLAYKDVTKALVPELMKSRNAVEQFNTKLLEEGKLLDSAAAKHNKAAAALDEMATKQQQQANTIQSIGSVVTSYVNDSLSGTIDEYQTFGDTLILMSIDILRQMVPVWSAQILGYSLSSFESVASWGALGVAKWVSIMAILNGALSAVEGSVKNKISERKEAANGSTRKYADGKYPGVQTGTYGDRPHYALFNEVPGYPEMVVDGRTFKTMQMNYPELINAIYRIRDGKQPGGYADGKYEDGGENLAQPYTDPELKALIAAGIESNKQTQELLKKGVKAYINKYGTNGLEEAIADIEKFKSKVFKD